MPLRVGSPLREDDGGGRDPRASTAAPWYALTLSHVIQREPTATEESPGWFRRGNDNGAEITLSFPRFARESPGWLLKDNDNALLCP